MTSERAKQDLAAKDRRIDDLVSQAGQLVADLDETVANMKRILGVASQAKEAEDEQQPGGH